MIGTPTSKHARGRANSTSRPGSLGVGLLAAVLLVTSSCIEEQKGILYLNFNLLPPDTTSELTAHIEGEVVRTPARTGLISVVTAEGGATTVVDTASPFNLFELDVPLVADAENLISITARDNTDAVSPNPAVFLVVHIAAPASSADPESPR